MSDQTTFFVLAIAATIGYSFQSTLMTSFYRQIDRLSAVSLRGLSLGITMAPLLLFVDFASYPPLATVAPIIGGAAVAAALGNWCAAKAFSFLPVGIASALTMSFAAVNVVALGFVFFGEALGFNQLILIALLLAGVFALGVTKSTGVLPEEYHVAKGIVSAAGFGLFLGIGYTAIAAASRRHHPFAVGYFWEFSIGVVALLFAAIRRASGGPGLAELPPRQLGKLALYCSPTVLGTGAYAAAMTKGPVGIATAILSTLMVFNTILARLLYGEKLSRLQCAILGVVCLLVAGLRYSTN